MSMHWRLLWVALILTTAGRAVDTAATIKLPDFPLPRFAKDRYGADEELSVVRLLREIHRGGVHGSNKFEAADSAYAVVTSSSMGLLCAWLEAACTSVGLDLTQARSGKYDGAVYARLLSVATSIAAARKAASPLAMPLGVMICTRQNAWGTLPGDGRRDAYVVIATEKGVLVFDPPTRQISLLSDYPNNAEVLQILF